MPTTYMLGPFHLDAETKMLFRGAEPVALGQRAAAVLRVLVEKPGILISKDALIEAAWPGLIVEEGNLAVQIAALRRVLGQEPGADRWIETLARRGYRFIGPVSGSDREAMAAAPQLSIVSNPTLPELPSIAVLPFQNMSGDPE